MAPIQVNNNNYIVVRWAFAIKMRDCGQIGESASFEAAKFSAL